MLIGLRQPHHLPRMVRHNRSQSPGSLQAGMPRGTNLRTSDVKELFPADEGSGLETVRFRWPKALSFEPRPSRAAAAMQL